MCRPYLTGSKTFLLELFKVTRQWLTILWLKTWYSTPLNPTSLNASLGPDKALTHAKSLFRARELLVGHSSSSRTTLYQERPYFGHQNTSIVDSDRCFVRTALEATYLSSRTSSRMAIWNTTAVQKQLEITEDLRMKGQEVKSRCGLCRLMYHPM